MRRIDKAQPGSYPAYSEMYMKLLPNDGRVLEHLLSNFDKARELMYSVPDDQLLYRYDPDKWSIKEVLVHIIDDERIFAYRALRFARNEKANLIGFDQDAYARYSAADDRTLDSIFDEYRAVRWATIALFEHLPENALDRMGHGTGSFNDATVRALVYHIAGHEQHHINLIKEKYLNNH